MEYIEKVSKDFDSNLKKQWLITNGIGGFASSTIIGCNTRKYHGLLIGPLNPPYNRIFFVSKINESININNRDYELSSNECLNYISNGFKYQTDFKKKNNSVEFEYKINDICIKKYITMVYNENTTIVKYVINTKNSSCKIQLSNLINFRDFHSTNNSFINFSQIEFDNTNTKIIYNTEDDLYIYTNIQDYEKYKEINYNNMKYRVEAERGLDFEENHFIPGVYSVNIPANTCKEIYICFSTHFKENVNVQYINKMFDIEQERIERIIQKAGLYDEYANSLVVSSDQFIINKDNEYGILAGYPWFDEWGRDTFIAFEGLLLVTKRVDIAKSVLLSSINHIKDGIMPNTFNNQTGQGLYNSVDAGLWFFEAVYKFLKYTNEYDFIYKNIYPALREIILKYIDGTLYDIYVDKDDGLLHCGNENTQLTWMDAKIGDFVVTPRNGKCVEINALWYNALNVISNISFQIKGKTTDYELYNHLAKKCYDSFNKKFWNQDKNCLYDVIEPYSSDIRPNQILAISLSFKILEDKYCRNVLNVVEENLYTPYGLRTLSPYSKSYIGKYEGDVVLRDKAYHQRNCMDMASYRIYNCIFENK